MPLLSHLTTKANNVLNFYDFVDSLKSASDAGSYYMCSLDMTSLYTNIPVEETIQIIIDALYTNEVQLHNGLNSKQFRKLLE